MPLSEDALVEEVKNWPTKSLGASEDAVKDEMKAKPGRKSPLAHASTRLQDPIPDPYTASPPETLLSSGPVPPEYANPPPLDQTSTTNGLYSNEHFSDLMAWAATPVPPDAEPSDPTTPPHIAKILTDWM